MGPAEIIKRLHAAGVHLTLTGDRLSAAPASRMNDELRDLIRSHKPELVAFLVDSHKTTAQLLAAAMLACDRHGDNPAAREAMRADCLATPPHLRADLLAHFKQTYPESKP